VRDGTSSPGAQQSDGAHQIVSGMQVVAEQTYYLQTDFGILLQEACQIVASDHGDLRTFAFLR